MSQKLLENYRMTYRELAEITGIAVSAVHKRPKKWKRMRLSPLRPQINKI
ncbi:MAG: winged helix-turn-helix transcriptional regulator [Candidatus Hodarchaeota archaeon]